MMAFCAPVVLHEHGEHPLSLLSAPATVYSWYQLVHPSQARLQAGKGELKALILSRCVSGSRPPWYWYGGGLPFPTSQPPGEGIHMQNTNIIYIYICTYYLHIHILHVHLDYVYMYNIYIYRYVDVDAHI